MPKKKSKAADSPPAKAVEFEEALGELQEIVTEMEDDRVSLEDLLKKYERGTKLLGLCQTHITQARHRIEQIQQQAKNGDLALEPFDQEAGESTKSAGSNPAESTPTRDDDIQLL